jgi:polyisoprenoid-binding protein YceI
MLKIPTLRHQLKPARILVALAAFSAATVSSAETLTLEPAKTKLALHLPATGHDVEGTLALKAGTIEFDRAAGTAGGLIEIDALKTATGSGSRDKKMHEEVLLSAKFPLIAFKPQKIVGTLPSEGKGQITLVGTLTLIGQARELSLPTEVEIQGQTVKAKSSFKIPFVAWGLKDPSILFLKVDKEVQIKLELEGALTN